MVLALRRLQHPAEGDDGVADDVAARCELRDKLRPDVGLDPFTYRLSDVLPGEIANGVLGHGDLLEPSGLTGVGSKRMWKPTIGFNQGSRDFLDFWVARTSCLDGVRSHKDSTSKRAAN